jgi:mannosylglycerate hydrolase
MHWDREWYFTTQESQILLVNNMAEILERLESDPNYPAYILDGQMAILEDYFAVVPENRERVKKLVEAGRLVVGPWYSQMDEMLTSGESITRNLLYGYKDAKALGQAMQIGYIPDSFGQTAQMPMILNQFDIKYSMFWRGTSERHGTDKTEFYWESSDGSRVLVQLLPLGYAIGKYLPLDEKVLRERMDKYFSVLDKGATGETELLPNGHDQMPIQQNICEILEQLRKIYPDREFFLSRYENVFEEIEKNEGLATISGEFIDGKYERVHRSIYGTRMDLKAYNARIESKLTNILEPLASIAYSLGFEYHHGLIEQIWKLIMKNHAHDSMGACCSDKVHFEIKARYFEAEERCNQLIDFYKRKITEASPDKAGFDKLAIYNFLPYTQNRLVHTIVTTRWAGFDVFDASGKQIGYQIRSVSELDPGLIDRQIVHYGNYEPFFQYEIEFRHDLPAMGYEIVYIKQSAERKQKVGKKVLQAESDFYRISANANGTVKIFDKKKNQTYDNVFALDDTADDGDEYDFSPLPEERPVSSIGIGDAQAEILEFEHEFLVTTRYNFSVPEALTENRQRAEQFVEIPVQLEVHIEKKSRILSVNLTLENTAKDHRLRLLIPTGIASNVSLADNQFGTISRPVLDSAMEVWEKEGWDERPDAIYPFLSHISLSDDKHTVGLLTKSSREYEIIGKSFDTIALTVLRAIGVLGKEELYRRPGRPSGIKLAVPDSQMLGSLSLDLALSFTENADEIAQDTKIYLTNVETYNQMPFHAMKLNKSLQKTPDYYSLFENLNPDLILSTVKKAEDEEIILARFYNPTKKNLTLEGKYACYSLKEEPRKEELREPNFSDKIRPNQVLTIKL